MTSRTMQRNRWLVFGLFGASAGLLAIYLCFAHLRLEEVNTDLVMSDQQSYMNIARRMVESDYTRMPPRDRMPLYPFLQSLLYCEGMDDETFFRRGKHLNVALSVLLLGALYPLLRRSLTGHQTLNILLVTAFTVYVFKAPFLQPELLYFFFWMCAFVLLVGLLVRPSHLGAGLAGLALAAAHFTKASAPPLLVLYLVFAGVGALRIVSGNPPKEGAPTPKVKALLAPIIVLAVFLGLLSPYLLTSKKVFGRYFYNATTTYWIWYDSWDEVKAGTRAHRDGEQIPDLPEAELPGPGKYLREHSLGDIVDRAWAGFAESLKDCRRSHGWFKHVLLYLIFGLSMVLFGPGIRVRLLANYTIPALFVISICAVSIALTSWYAAIASGTRFVLHLFLPTLFVVSWAAKRFADQEPLTWSVPLGNFRLRLDTAFNWLITIIVFFDVSRLFFGRALKYYGGN